MQTKVIEVTNGPAGNWGKFLVGRMTEEWQRRAKVLPSSDMPLLRQRGWGPEHLLVLDLETGEGAMFFPGGMASADLGRHRILVCPLFEAFLTWLYRQDLSDLSALPDLVNLEAPFALSGYRRAGPQPPPVTRHVPWPDPLAPALPQVPLVDPPMPSPENRPHD